MDRHPDMVDSILEIAVVVSVSAKKESGRAQCLTLDLKD
jgi:hypothetical protein